jgi:hypothetical protein
LSGNDHGNKYIVLGWLPDSSQRRESYQYETNLPDYFQHVHVLHEREDEKEGEPAIYYVIWRYSGMLF